MTFTVRYTHLVSIIKSKSCQRSENYIHVCSKPLKYFIIKIVKVTAVITFILFVTVEVVRSSLTSPVKQLYD